MLDLVFSLCFIFFFFNNFFEGKVVKLFLGIKFKRCKLWCVLEETVDLMAFLVV